ncbi:hypothetical protein FOZ63_013074, partial [Perkinsus olseni]
MSHLGVLPVLEAVASPQQEPEKKTTVGREADGLEHHPSFMPPWMNVDDLPDILGDKAICESCRLSFRLTSNVYIVCAECPKEAGRVCLCVKCFANGVEFGNHLRTHKYIRTLSLVYFELYLGE